MNKAPLNEAETRTEMIDSALKASGWGEVEASRVRREVMITLGRLQGGGKRARQDIADYVLMYRGQQLAVIEAKKRGLPVTEGLAQAKRYAERLQARFAYSTNGDGVYRIDMETGAEGEVAGYPSPEGLWAETFGGVENAIDVWRKRFGAVPFEDKGGFWQARYYQHNADTYAYFGEPVYVYSLKEGINDGFLTPFRVQQFDFVKAYEHFNDPEWDGEPLAPEPCATCGEKPCVCAFNPPEPCPVCGERPCQCEKEPPEPCENCGEQPCVCERHRKVKVKLANGKERTIQHMSATSFWSPDGKPISAAEFIQRLFGDLPGLFADEDELRRLWGWPDTCRKLLEGLEEKGYGMEQLAEVGKLIEAENSDLYDVLAYITFNETPITRAERVDLHREAILKGRDYAQQEFLRFILDHYVARGVGELSIDKLRPLVDLKYHSINDAAPELGPPGKIRKVFIEFQQHLYSE